MSLQPSKSDQDFTKNLIANQDVLLSPSIEQQNEASLDFFSFINNDSLMFNIIDQSTNVTSDDKNDDLDLFGIMPSNDPEVASLLETLNQSGFVVDFLPQISINTTNKILEGSIENTKEEVEGIYQIVQLKTECETPEPPSSPDSTFLVSTRSSQRLLNKRDTKWSRNEGLTLKQNKKKGSKHEKRANTLKRKRSLDDDDYSNYNSSESDSIDLNKNTNGRISKKFALKHNDNSVDFESDDHIYYDDDEDENDEVNDNDYFHSDDDENEKDFKNYVRDYNLSNGYRTGQRNDPNKKESNKEAATRYRLKKLTEKERLFQTRMCLENENNEVKRKIEMASTEINYLKSLLVQMLLTKGMIDSKI